MEWKCRKGGCNLLYLILCFYFMSSSSWASPLHNATSNVTNRRAYDVQPSHLVKEYSTPSIEMRPPPPMLTPSKPIMKSPQQQTHVGPQQPNQNPTLFQHKQIQNTQQQQQQIITSPTNTISTIYQPLSNKLIQPSSYINSEQDWRGMMEGQNYVQQLYRIPSPSSQQQQQQSPRQQQSHQSPSPQQPSQNQNHQQFPSPQQQVQSPYQPTVSGQQNQQQQSSPRQQQSQQPPSPQQQQELSQNQQQITTQGQPMHFTSNILDPSPSTEIQFLIHKPQDSQIIKSTLLQSAAANNENIQFINGPQLRLKQDQKLYLPPPKKTIVYVMMAEPTVDLNVEVMESPDSMKGEEPEVYVVYQKPAEERRVMHHGSSHTGENSHTGEKEEYHTGQASNHHLVYEKSGKLTQFGSKLKKDVVPMVMCATPQQPDQKSTDHKN